MSSRQSSTKRWSNGFVVAAIGIAHLGFGGDKSNPRCTPGSATLEEWDETYQVLAMVKDLAAICHGMCLEGWIWLNFVVFLVDCVSVTTLVGR